MTSTTQNQASSFPKKREEKLDELLHFLRHHLWPRLKQKDFNEEDPEDRLYEIHVMERIFDKLTVSI